MAIVTEVVRFASPLSDPCCSASTTAPLGSISANSLLVLVLRCMSFRHDPIQNVSQLWDTTVGFDGFDGLDGGFDGGFDGGPVDIRSTSTFGGM